MIRSCPYYGGNLDPFINKKDSMNKKEQKKIDEVYAFLYKTSETFRNLSMDEQGALSIKVGKELTKREKK